MTLVSVIVPIYNVEKYLPACVESIVSQTWKNLQIILVDDGSTDSCPSLCDGYAMQDSRIEVVHKENGGLSDARNAGMAIARGEYWAFIDSDDVIAGDMIEYLCSMAERHNADMAVCQRTLINEEGKTLRGGAELFDDYVLTDNKACMHDFLSVNRIDTVAWGKLYRRELFNEVRYPKGKYHEDVFTTYKLVALSEVIAVGAGRKYMYRIRGKSITQSSFSPKHLDAVEGKCEMAAYMAVHYPSELRYAQAGIIYAANQCVLRMALSGCLDRDAAFYLQSKYRAYEGVFLRYGRNRLVSKAFSIVAYLSVRKTIRLVSFLQKLRAHA